MPAAWPSTFTKPDLPGGKYATHLLTIPNRKNRKSALRSLFSVWPPRRSAALIKQICRNGRDSNPRPVVTGRYSNRLNYRCASAGLSSISRKSWWLMNCAPAYDAVARSKLRSSGSPGQQALVWNMQPLTIADRFCTPQAATSASLGLASPPFELDGDVTVDAVVMTT